MRTKITTKIHTMKFIKFFCILPEHSQVIQETTTLNISNQIHQNIHHLNIYEYC